MTYISLLRDLVSNYRFNFTFYGLKLGRLMSSELVHKHFAMSNSIN